MYIYRVDLHGKMFYFLSSLKAMLYFFAHNFFVPVRIVFKKKTLRFCFAVENSGSSSFSFHSWTEFKKNKTREDI